MSTTLEQQQRVDKAIQEELLNDEIVLWSGQPLRSVVFHRSDWYAIPFNLLWGGFAIFWEAGATNHSPFSSLKSDNALFFALWGIPFVIMGQYLIWGRFLYAAWKKGSTYYAVTTRRVLVVTSGATRKSVSSYLRTIDSISITVRQDGIGMLEFSPEPERLVTAWNARPSRRGLELDIDLSRLVFYDIPDARRVYELIQTARKDAHD
jgi:hypothetical protein